MKLLSQNASKKKKRSTKVPMEQKRKLKPTLNLRDLRVDDNRGVFAIVSAQRCLVREKSLVSVYSVLRKYTKKLGLFWIKPVRIKIITTKGEKRMGKGKGTQITYNRRVVIPAGAVIFEIGQQNNLKNGCIPFKRIFDAINSRLPFKVLVRRAPGLSPLFSIEDATNYTYQK